MGGAVPPFSHVRLWLSKAHYLSGFRSSGLWRCVVGVLSGFRRFEGT